MVFGEILRWAMRKERKVQGRSRPADGNNPKRAMVVIQETTSDKRTAQKSGRADPGRRLEEPSGHGQQRKSKGFPREKSTTQSQRGGRRRAARD